MGENRVGFQADRAICHMSMMMVYGQAYWGRAMMGERGVSADDWDEVLGVERPRLIRLCAHLTGDARVAEDLAQETLLEAWRQGHKLRERAGQDRWLSAIARNVCRRWARTRARDAARGLPSHREDEDAL